MARLLMAAGAAVALGLIAYQVVVAPGDALPAWTPPAGLDRADTPDWLQTLCADSTPALCTAGDRARGAQDCEAMRAALQRLHAVERELVARGAVSPRQHWVLVELYQQGHELCQFEREQQ